MNGDINAILYSPDGINSELLASLFQKLLDEGKATETFLELAELFNYLHFKNRKTVYALFGASSEHQITLEDYDENGNLKDDVRAALETADEVRREIEVADEEYTEVVTRRKKHYTRQTEQIDKLPVQEIHLYPEGEEFERVRALCFESKPTEYCEIVTVPQKLFNQKTICHNYLYTDEYGQTHSFEPQKPVSKLIEGSYVSPSLISHVIYNKCILDLPLYRQTRHMERLGLYLSRQTLSNWMISVTELYLETLYNAMREDLETQKTIHIDETPLRVIQNPKDNKNKLGTIMVGRSGHFEEFQMAVFYYASTKSKADFVKFLDEEFGGNIVCDDASSHNVFSAANLCTCHAHCRRRFVEAIRNRADYRQYCKLSAAQKEKYLQEKKNARLKLVIDFLALYRKLYSIEKRARELNETPAQIRERRQKESLPVFEAMVELNRQILKGVVPRTELYSAASYFHKNEARLRQYLYDGAVAIDNNACERMVKYFVMGRKNFLFANTERGAKTAAICYTIMVSALLNHLNPEAYLTYVLDTLRKEGLRDDVVRRLLPYSPELPANLRMPEEVKLPGVYREV